MAPELLAGPLVVLPPRPSDRAGPSPEPDLRPDGFTWSLPSIRKGTARPLADGHTCSKCSAAALGMSTAHEVQPGRFGSTPTAYTPPRRHGDTENDHGAKAVSRSPSRCPQGVGEGGTGPPRGRGERLRQERLNFVATGRFVGSVRGCTTYDGGHRARHDNDRGRSAVSNPSAVLRRSPCLCVSVVRCRCMLLEEQRMILGFSRRSPRGR